MEFVEISAGEFLMGCSPKDTQCRDNEKPPHRVRITRGFDMGKYKVTQAQWEAVMDSTRSAFRGADRSADRPVEMVNWNDIHEFLEKLNARNDGYHYRLPTEAEWEYAARAGTQDARYGYEADEVGWHDDNSGGETHPVGEKRRNGWGLYDMLGNVWEWCQDRYDDDYYGNSPVEDPAGPSSGSTRVLRGGCWLSDPGILRVSCRGEYLLGFRSSNNGFRCVREKK